MRHIAAFPLTLYAEGRITRRNGRVRRRCTRKEQRGKEVIDIDDGKIIDMFFAGEEAATVELTKKYGKLCRSILQGLLTDESNVEECANDVWLAVWHAIPPNHPQYLAAFV